MRLTGKIILGGTMGYLIGGPIGGVVGAFLDHCLFDRTGNPDASQGRPITRSPDPQSPRIFFVAVFGVMGHISKADGRVSREEEDFARRVMKWMHLNDSDRKIAYELFRKGHNSEITLDEFLDDLLAGVDEPRLIDDFMHIQIDIANADGHMAPRERNILEHIQHRLNLPPDTVDSILQERSQIAFLTATFWVMGYIFRAAYGPVSKNESDFAENIMRRQMLDSKDREFARKALREGRSGSKKALNEMLEYLRRECNDSGIIESFLNIQINAAKADGHVGLQERKILEHIQHRLNIPPDTVDSILREKANIVHSIPSDLSTTEAYALLELEKGCSKADLIRAYGRKTRQIKAAYEHLRQIKR